MDPEEEVEAVDAAEVGVKDLVDLEVPLEEWVEQVLQVQMAIVHGMVRGDVTGMVEGEDGEAGMRANRLPGLSLGMESEGGRMRGSRVGLLLVLSCSLQHVSLAIQLFHRPMSFHLVLLIATSVQHSVWKMDKILAMEEVDPKALEEGLDKAREAKEDLEDVGVLVAMEAMVASKEEMEAAEVGEEEEETEEVVGMEEEVERVLSEELEVLEVLVVLVVLALMAIVRGTGLGVVTEGRLAGVARVVLARRQRRQRRKVDQERHRSQWLAAAGGRSPSGSNTVNLSPANLCRSECDRRRGRKVPGVGAGVITKSLSGHRLIWGKRCGAQPTTWHTMLCYAATCAMALWLPYETVPTHARLAHFLVSRPNIETAGFKTILCSLIPKDNFMLNFAQTVILTFLPSHILL